MVSHNHCWKLECWLYIFTTTRANRVCKSFFFITFSLSTELLEDKQRFKLGGVDTSPLYLLFQTLLPLFWTLTCMIWMELTRTDAVFSRLSMVLFMCRNKSSRNDLKLHGDYFWKIRKFLKLGGTWGGHLGGHNPPGRAYPPGTPRWVLPTWWPSDANSNSIYWLSGRKNQREEIIAFYDTEPPPYPNLSREGWCGVHSGLWRGESVAVVIINHPPSLILWCSPPCVSNS